MDTKKLMAVFVAAIITAMPLTAAAPGLSRYVSQSNGAVTYADIVIGSHAGDPVNYPKDVIASADIAGYIGQFGTVSTSGTGFSITGEGKEISTAGTKIYLGDTLGKSGLHSTLTSQDLPTLLASDKVIDENSVSVTYDQSLFLTPSSASEKYTLEFERPSGTSNEDGAYSIGRFSTSPRENYYFVKYRLTFRKGADLSALTGKTLTIAGETYTILAESTAEGTPQIVTARSAETRSVLVSDGKITIEVGEKTHTIEVIGTSGPETVILSVNGEIASAKKDKTTNINGLEVFVDDVFHFTNNNERTGARLLIGAEKVTFKDGSKIKVEDDNVDGTLVSITTSSDKLDTMEVLLGAPENRVDNLKEGSSYVLPGFPTIELYFPGISEDVDSSSRNTLEVTASGDNLIEMEWTDSRGLTESFAWAYKSASTGSDFSLADSNGDSIHIAEGSLVSQDEYIVIDAGNFPHLMQLTGIDSSALSFTLRDVFSGESTKIELSESDNGRKTFHIDGQAYHAQFNSENTGISLTWGDASGFGDSGDATTVWPTLKGSNGEQLALISRVGVDLTAEDDKEIQLPTGAVRMTVDSADSGSVVSDVSVTGISTTSGSTLTLTAITDEDGETSACTTTPCVDSFELSPGNEATFTLGKTARGGVTYRVSATSTSGDNTFTISVEGTPTETISQPTILLVEEKDSAGDRYSVLVSASTETSGSNNVAIPAAPIFTASADSQTRGGDSTITDYVDIYGTFVVRTTSSQDTVTIRYPDEQVFAIVGVGEADAEVSVGTSGGRVALSSPVAKLDIEIDTGALEKDLILIGGPCANKLVAELAEEHEEIPTCDKWDLSTGLIFEVEDAFDSGHKVLVIAGTTGDDTRALAEKAMKGTLDYSA